MSPSSTRCIAPFCTAERSKNPCGSLFKFSHFAIFLLDLVALATTPLLSICYILFITKVIGRAYARESAHIADGDTRVTRFFGHKVFRVPRHGEKGLPKHNFLTRTFTQQFHIQNSIPNQNIYHIPNTNALYFFPPIFPRALRSQERKRKKKNLTHRKTSERQTGRTPTIVSSFHSPLMSRNL